MKIPELLRFRNIRNYFICYRKTCPGSGITPIPQVNFWFSYWFHDPPPSPVSNLAFLIYSFSALLRGIQYLLYELMRIRWSNVKWLENKWNLFCGRFWHRWSSVDIGLFCSLFFFPPLVFLPLLLSFHLVSMLCGVKKFWGQILFTLFIAAFKWTAL